MNRDIKSEINNWLLGVYDTGYSDGVDRVTHKDNDRFFGNQEAWDRRKWEVINKVTNLILHEIATVDYTHRHLAKLTPPSPSETKKGE